MDLFGEDVSSEEDEDEVLFLLCNLILLQNITVCVFNLI
jgi:hypothetical protein